MTAIIIPDSSSFMPAQHMVLGPSGTHLSVTITNYYGNGATIFLDKFQTERLRDYLNDQLTEPNASNSTSPQ